MIAISFIVLMGLSATVRAEARLLRLLCRCVRTTVGLGLLMLCFPGRIMAMKTLKIKRMKQRGHTCDCHENSNDIYANMECRVMAALDTAQHDITNMNHRSMEVNTRHTVTLLITQR